MLLSNRKSLWQSYALAAATQESLWKKSYTGNVAVDAVKQEWFMEKLCSRLFPGTAYGKVMFLLVLPHRKAPGFVTVRKQKAYGNLMFSIAAIKQKSLWKSYVLDPFPIGQREQLMEKLCSCWSYHTEKHMAA